MNWYYRMAAGLLFAILTTVGAAWIWQKTAGMPETNSMRGAWMLFCFGAMLNMAGSVWPAALVGINGVRTSQQIFLSALLVNYAITVPGLLLGWQLWAMVGGQLGQGLTIRIAGKILFHRQAGEQFRRHAGRVNLPMMKTLWPMSWRTAVVGLGAFLIVQANTLICSSYLGLEETGSYGLSLQLVSALSGVSGIWVAVKAPLMNQLRVAGQTRQLAQLFIERIRWCILTYAAGACVLLLLGPNMAFLLGSKTHLLSTPLLALLLGSMFLEMHHSQYAVLVLSENRNPFVLPALLSGIAVVCISLFLTPRFGVLGLVLSFGLVQLAFNNWWTVLRGIHSLSIHPRSFVAAFVRLNPPAEGSS